MSIRTPQAARSLLLKRTVAWGLSMTLICPPMGGLLGAAQAQSTPSESGTVTQSAKAVPHAPGPVQPAYGADSVLLFPFTNSTKDPNGDAVAAKVLDALKLRIATTGAYQAITYTKFLAPVQRALNDSVLQDADLAGPFDSEKAGKIAKQVQTDDYLVGEVDSITTDPQSQKVSIEVTATLRNTKTGSSIKTVAFTGTGTALSNSDSPDVITQRAVNDVASQLAAAIYPENHRPIVVPASQRGHSKAGQAVLLAVLTGVLAFAVFHNSGGGGGGSSITTGGGGGTGTGGGGGGGIPGPPAPPSPP